MSHTYLELLFLLIQRMMSYTLILRSLKYSHITYIISYLNKLITILAPRYMHQKTVKTHENTKETKIKKSTT